MTEQADPRAVPALMPHLVCAKAEQAIDFYKEAFGAQEHVRLPGPDGRLWHAALGINGGMVMLADEFPEHGSFSPKSLNGTPVTIHLVVPDSDAAIARAQAAGAKVIMAAADMFWGDRYGMIEDPFGHRWALATPQGAPMTSEQLREAARMAMDNSN